MRKSIDTQIIELRNLLVLHVGELDRLYSFTCEVSAPCVLYPPTTDELVTIAEQSLGFTFPPMLRAVYTCIGNGGLALRLLGLKGGQPGGELFPGLSAVEIYQELERWRQAGNDPHLPPYFLPVNDDLGCGMVDYVDCRTAEGKIWREDTGQLVERQPTLMAYFMEGVQGYPLQRLPT